MTAPALIFVLALSALFLLSYAFPVLSLIFAGLFFLLGLAGLFLPEKEPPRVGGTDCGDD